MGARSRRVGDKGRRVGGLARITESCKATA